MKRIILLTFTLLLGIFCYAQSEHLKFSGIPIDGTISQFQEKLVQKGYIYKKRNSELPSKGVRCYHGTYADNKAELVVYYDERTSVVYRVKAMIRQNTMGNAERKYFELQSLLLKKYRNYENTKIEKPTFMYLTKIYIERDDSLADYEPNIKDLCGTITLYIKEDENYKDHECKDDVQVDYLDQINSDKYEDRLLNEL